MSSTFESKHPLELGEPIPSITGQREGAQLIVKELLNRTAGGGYLYELEVVEIHDEIATSE